MSKRLAYVLITPHTIRKSRTGAVLSRLLGNTTSLLVGAQIVALDAVMTEAFAASIREGANVDEELYRSLIRSYIRRNFAPSEDGRRHRALMLLFCGERVHEELMTITGHFISPDSGETIRGAFGDEVIDEDGRVRYFEPAVLYSEPDDINLDVWIDFLSRYPNLVDNSCVYREPERVQRTLVLIKPDSFRQRSLRPGAVVDMFSRTGLRVIGCKLVHMSVAQALEFYGPVEAALVGKLAPAMGGKALGILEKELNFRLPAGCEAALVRAVGEPYAREQFERLVQFMTGRRPSETPPEEWDRPGTLGCLALVYEGEDAVRKIRDVLGPTDPTQAPDGTVRREFGSDVMINTAHASDSPENAEREMRILKMNEPNLLALIDRTLAKVV